MRHARSYARENAIKGLYEYRINKNATYEKIKDRLAISIVKEIVSREPDINAYIQKYLKKWSVLELNPVVLGTLQVGVYELEQKKIDKRIIISDLLKISNEYLEKKEVKFVHFVLDSISKDIDVN